MYGGMLGTLGTPINNVSDLRTDSAILIFIIWSNHSNGDVY